MTRTVPPWHYSDDGTHIYSWGGNRWHISTGGNVYSFSGKFIGWFNNGWIRDIMAMQCCLRPIPEADR